MEWETANNKGEVGTKTGITLDETTTTDDKTWARRLASHVWIRVDSWLLLQRFE